MDGLQLRDIVGSTLYVTIDSSRRLSGTLVAVDAQANLLLDDVTELCGDSRRALGLVSVPFDTIADVQVSSKLLDQRVQYRQRFLRDVV